MKAEAKSLRFLGESPQKLTIPFFQRGYVWKEENWKELLESLCDENAKPFLGSIIIKTVNCVNPTEAQVIDGQQRLTTLTLLSKAIYDTLTLDKANLQGNDPYDDEEDEEDKYGKSELKSFLFYKVNAADPFKKAHVKIQHSKVDKDAYETIIKENFIEKKLTYCNDLEMIDMDSEETSPILKCYKYFRLELRQMAIENIIELHNSMYSDGKKMIVLITMELDDDNEQLIFDTINRAGVHLSVSDIIKNDLFKKCLDLCGDGNESTVVNKYEEKWEKVFYIYEKGEPHIWDDIRVFGNQQRTNLDFLLYCVAFVRWGKQEEIFSDLAKVYKINTQNYTLDELYNLVDQINVYANIFSTNILMLQEKYKAEDDPMLFSYDEYIKRLLLILEVYGVQMFYPFVLKLLVEKDNLGDDYVKDEFKKLESFVVRRRLSGKGVSDYATKCDLVIKNGANELVVEMDNDESGISNNDIGKYLESIKSENARLLLFVIELYKRQNGMHDIRELNYKYSLEHIMPRSWQKKWLNVPITKMDGTSYISDDGAEIDVISEEGQKIRKQHIESLGNMTLLSQSLNASIKNNTFDKKINGEGENKPGYRQYTSLYITKELVDEFDSGKCLWNEGTIEKRRKNLEKLILEIWPNQF